MRIAPSLALVWLRGWKAPQAMGRVTSVDAIPSGGGFVAGTTLGFVHRLPCEDEGTASTVRIAPGKTILSVAAGKDDVLGAYFYDPDSDSHKVRVGVHEIRHQTPILAHGQLVDSTEWCAVAMDGSWRVMDSRTGVITADHRAADGGATCAAFVSSTVALGHLDKNVVVYEARSGRRLSAHKVPGVPVSLARGHGRIMFVTTSDGSVYRMEPGNVFIPPRTIRISGQPIAEKTSCSGASWCGGGTGMGVCVLSPRNPPIRVQDARMGVMAEGGAVAVVRGAQRIDAYLHF